MNTTRKTIRARIRERAQQIREQRNSGNGFWAALKALFGDIDQQAQRQAEERRRRHAAARTRMNRDIPFDERDMLPGGRYEQATGRRPSAYWGPR